jgi:hypothetical protein
MSGLPGYNYAAFNAAAVRYREAGFEVENPAEHFGGRTDLPYPQYMRAAIRCLLMCDMIVLLPGWKKSKGARLEYRIAVATEMEVLNKEQDP